MRTMPFLEYSGYDIALIQYHSQKGGVSHMLPRSQYICISFWYYNFPYTEDTK